MAAHQAAPPGILQARTLEWVVFSFSNAWKWKVKGKSFSHVRLLATPWTAAYQAPPSMGFSRQEYWSGVSLPSPWRQCVCVCVCVCVRKLYYLFTLDTYSDFLIWKVYCTFRISYTSLSMWGRDSGQSKRQKKEKEPLIQWPERIEFYKEI